MTFDKFSHQADSRCATNRIFQVLGNIHDLEAYYRIDNALSLNATIFLSHWAHLAIIWMWLAGCFFHISWTGNYELWIQNPIKTIPIAHNIFDPHFGSSEIENNVCYSGLYNWMYSTGFTSNQEIYNLTIGLECLSLASILLAFVHLIWIDAYLQWLNWNAPTTFKSGLDTQFKLNLISLYKVTSGNPKFMLAPLRVFMTVFDLTSMRLNFHLAGLLGFSSIAWAGHLIHQALPVSRGVKSGWSTVFSQGTVFGQDMDKDNHIYGSTYGASQLQLQLASTFHSSS
jgi:photosystem I P700 chlorophyll a apoprotein A2